MTFLPEWANGLVSGDVDEPSLYLAAEAGAWPDLPRAERRAFALVVLALLDARAEGATRLRLGSVPERLVRLGAGAEDRQAAARLVERLAELPALVGGPGDYRPFILDDGCLYDERAFRLETRLAAELGARLSAPALAPAPGAVRAALAAAADPSGRPWTAAQEAAIEGALRRSVTVISGGPGTGKTAVIGGIVRAFAALGIPTDQIAIAAPTGKAANRIAELLAPGAPTPSTLHRLLGNAPREATTRGGAFRHHENRPLPHAAVIVDEASMVGLALMEQLVRALPRNARLVLVGDADQLPAVDAGSVLRDLGSLALPLVESHRMDPADPSGAAVLDAARAIAAGDLGSRGTPALRRPAELPSAGFACLDPGPGEAPARRLLDAFVAHWYETTLRPGGEARFDADADDVEAVAALLDRHRRRRILTVTRRGLAGSARINETLARRFAADAGLPTGGGELAPGTPVLMTHNDYDRGLFNGDQGLVVRGARGAASFAVFPRAGQLVPFPLAGLRGELEVAYASTVHKAQGSELDHAALVLPEVDLPLLTRELVYTAVTRVRRSIVVVGHRPLLEQAVGRPLERSSGLAARLTVRSPA